MSAAQALSGFSGVTWSTPGEALRAIVRALGGEAAVKKLEQLADFAMSTAGEDAVWGTLFQNANFPQAPVIQGSTTAGSWYVALHTANPGASGTQTTSEAAYTSYARVGVARSTGGWTLTGNDPITAENEAAVTFPACTGSTETETYFSLGQESSGAGVIYISAALTSSLAVSNGITPSFAIDQLQATLT